MSTIKGQVREPLEERVKKVGLAVVNVVTINPTNKELEEYFSFSTKENQEDIEYTGVDKEGNSYTRVDFWVKSKVNHIKETVIENDGEKIETIKTDGGYIFKIAFFLTDKIRKNKEETKTQFIDNIGNCSWAESEETLPSWFLKRPYREAYIGEEQFYNFLRVWLGGLDFRKEETELQLSWKEVLKGDFSALKEQIDGVFSTNFIAAATIVTKSKENEDGTEEIVEYQNIYNKQFLPEYCMKYFKNTNYDDPMLIESIKSKLLKDLKLHEKFVANITGEYGCNDYYVLSPLRDYDPSENMMSTDKAMIEGGDAVSSDY